MIKQFTIYTKSNRTELAKEAIEAMLNALGVTKPRILVTQLKANELDVVVAIDDNVEVR